MIFDFDFKIIYRNNRQQKNWSEEDSTGFMPRSVTRKDRQEVAFHSKQKYEERKKRLATRDRRVEKRGCRGGEQRRKRIDIDNEEEWKEKKSSKLVCSTQPAGGTKGEWKLGQLGVPAPGKRVGSIFSLSFSRLLLHAGTYTRAGA